MLDVDSVQVRSESKVVKSERAVANEVTACFTEGIVVATPEGKVSIESIQEGDSVYAYNEQTKEVETRSVTATSKRWYEGSIIHIVVDADTIQATTEHPFYVEGSWVEAEDLKVGDRLTLLGGRTDNVRATWSRDTALFVYNFTVEEQHTYYVSNSGVLVHNQCATEYEAALAKEVAAYNKLADLSLDCSDIASLLQIKHTGGYILEITPKNGSWMIGIEYGIETKFMYHQVFVKGKYVYDPMFGSNPVLTSDFIKAYQNMNPTGINLLRR